ncbi:family 43 glycosylhydrolase [Dysgonomonas sp. 511]|uniref:family 43 glycosylhydrolase n=1 Tax=Dysgonomonas sp. 511 TaxID=2302930 RepID=UPI0013D720CA|nr:family 43 glycosylhydrolase [Dysgonomonas sp. 511]NDV79798.1 arabinan endo-1,5-alpha-L-arabinosidase [Dysgonomonas sp. 511]
MKKIIFLLITAACFIHTACGDNDDDKIGRTFKNPVMGKPAADPTIIRAQDGAYYIYTTGDLVPIYKSTNLIDWQYIGNCFTEATKPAIENTSGIWAPDIRYVDGKYVLYYSMPGTTSGQIDGVNISNWECAIGCAVADKPEGPFEDKGKMFNGYDINIQNCIDPCYVEENGKKYLFFGSWEGIYGVELSDDGFRLKEGTTPVQISGRDNEGAMIHKRGDYYYLFASWGWCCGGDESTYKTIYGRSESLFGPYLTKDGKNMIDGAFHILIDSNMFFAGPGHNSQIVTDDAGNDWMAYHSYIRAQAGKDRLLMVSQIKWTDDDWPYVDGNSPSLDALAPVF